MVLRSPTMATTLIRGSPASAAAAAPTGGGGNDAGVAVGACGAWGAGRTGATGPPGTGSFWGLWLRYDDPPPDWHPTAAATSTNKPRERRNGVAASMPTLPRRRYGPTGWIGHPRRRG